MNRLKDRKIPKLIGLVLSVILWIEAGILTVFWSLLGLIMMPLSMILDRGTGHLLHGIAALWARSMMVTNPVWQIKVEGLESIQKGRHYVIVANHQSALDILVLLSGLPLHFKFLAKQEIFPIPFIGWHMALAGYIPLDRQSHESGRKAIETASHWLRKSVSVVFFPEGTRSLNGEISAFKMGAFKLAQDENVEILPVVVEGTGDALPKKSWRLLKTTQFFLSIGKPVSLGTNRDSLESAKNSIRQEMVRCLASIRRVASD